MLAATPSDVKGLGLRLGVENQPSTPIHNRRATGSHVFTASSNS